MADPTNTPFRLLWSAALPENTGLITTTVDRAIVRCDEHVLAFDLDGKPSWSVTLGSGAGEGTWLTAMPGGIVATDTRRGPKRTSELVVIAGEKITKVATGCLASNRGICTVGRDFYVLGVDPAAGNVLRAFRADGKRVIDRKQAGRDLVPLADRLLVLDSFSEPGLVLIDRGGALLSALETTPAQEVSVAEGRAFSALRTADAPERTMRMYDLATGRPLWSHAGHGPSVELDCELALHLVMHDGKLVPVARHCGSGAQVWRASAGVGDDPGAFRFAGGLLLFTHGTGTTVYKRDNGEHVAELTGIYALAVHQHRVFFAGSSKLACVDAA